MIRWLINKLAPYLIARALSRKADFVIGGDENPYLLRWWLIPRNPLFNVYVHLFLRSDDDRALHDHPWLFNCSMILLGMYIEHTPDGSSLRWENSWKFRWGKAPHRVELVGDLEVTEAAVTVEKLSPCWTLFITGPRVRSWGFYCPQGWVHWKEFTASHDSGSIGKGCGS